MIARLDHLDEVKMTERASGVVQGTLEMLILRTLILEPMHGYGIGTRLTQISDGVLQVNGGSLFPALARLERNGLIKGEWRSTENSRKAKYYCITAQGRAKLKRETRDWEVQSDAIGRVLRASLGEL
jgi:PadR family transcriptional regulator, regulatory protein PadR